MTHSPPRAALIVAHGAPADPLPQEAVLRALAVEVGAHLPGWTVRGATLAADGALEAALEGLAQPLIYPFFMAEGYFTGTLLPRRLAAAGAADALYLRPFGADPGLAALVADVALSAARGAGMDPGRTTLLLAAHGSAVSRTSTLTTQAMATTLAATTAFAAIRAGYVEEAPFLVDAARGLGPAVCVPFFALRAGHVVDDVPDALAEAGFTGPILAPIGAEARVPALIARALAAYPSV